MSEANASPVRKISTNWLQENTAARVTNNSMISLTCFLFAFLLCVCLLLFFSFCFLLLFTKILLMLLLFLPQPSQLIRRHFDLTPKRVQFRFSLPSDRHVIYVYCEKLNMCLFILTEYFLSLSLSLSLSLYIYIYISFLLPTSVSFWQAGWDIT